ncbi:MAG TPA: carbohydrate ABC transporter substrate-binding protein, partial [Actinomycetota bacterium]|nr:carbohydrate ABC transporter substrate-binding protein [Actinomycetota bacterium]
MLSVLALAAAACGDGDDVTNGDDENGGAGTDLSGESVEVAAVWTGAEQERFEMVLAAFAEETGAEVSFTSTGDDIAAV